MNLKNTFIHHVYFWLKNPDSQEDLLKLVAGLEALSQVSEIKAFHIGRPALTDRAVIDSSYAVSWLNIFENEEQEYQHINKFGRGFWSEQFIDSFDETEKAIIIHKIAYDFGAFSY